MFNYFSLSDIEEYTTTLDEPELKPKLRASKSLDADCPLTVRDDTSILLTNRNTSTKFLALSKYKHREPVVHSLHVLKFNPLL